MGWHLPINQLKQFTSIALLFDLDGTIIDLGHDNRQLEILRNQIFNLLRAKNILVNNRSIFSMYELAAKRDTGLVAQIGSLIDLYEENCVSQALQIIPKEELLSIKLSLDNIVLTGLVTNNGRKCVVSAINDGFLPPDFFDVMVTRNDVKALKPSSNPIQLALKSSIPIEGIWFIGDSQNDSASLQEYSKESGIPGLFTHIETIKATYDG